MVRFVAVISREAYLSGEVTVVTEDAEDVEWHKISVIMLKIGEAVYVVGKKVNTIILAVDPDLPVNVNEMDAVPTAEELAGLGARKFYFINHVKCGE